MHTLRSGGIRSHDPSGIWRVCAYAWHGAINGDAWTRNTHYLVDLQLSGSTEIFGLSSQRAFWKSDCCSQSYINRLLELLVGLSGNIFETTNADRRLQQKYF